MTRVTRLGYFQNFLATNFRAKVDKIFGDFLGHFEKLQFQIIPTVATFWATFRNIAATFYSNIWSHCI